MILKSLRLNNWRNYHEAEAEFSPGLNIICGDNGKGKTNLLEAVGYLGLASSFRSAGERELIGNAADHFFIKGEGESLHGEYLCISAAADRHRRRKWRVNDVPCKRLADIIGLLPVVVFSPDDINIVKGGPDQRRRWLNRQLSLNSSSYCREILSYNRSLKQRNALLRQYQKQQLTPGPELDIWDKELIRHGTTLILMRRQAVEQLQPLAEEIHESLSGGEKPRLLYQCRINRGEGNEQELQEAFRLSLAAHRQAELLRGVTLVGPHGDDITFCLDELRAREFASQGQQRTLALTLKMAELELSGRTLGEYPLLLLDDVLSELDRERKKRVLALPEQTSTQTFITDAGNDFTADDRRSFLITTDEQGAHIFPGNR